jgi:hypothetical protein
MEYVQEAIRILEAAVAADASAAGKAHEAIHDTEHPATLKRAECCTPYIKKLCAEIINICNHERRYHGSAMQLYDAAIRNAQMVLWWAGEAEKEKREFCRCDAAPLRHQPH